MRFEAGENEAGRRLDRVLKKAFRDAPLSFVYRIIRKDVRVNGERATGERLLQAGDLVEILLPDSQTEALCGRNGAGRMQGRGGGEPWASRPSGAPKARKQFGVVFEDENILVVNKPYGLLTHGDAVEKKNTLANQVAAYLAETGAYAPGAMKTFAPAPASRLDRNTTGLILFGKNLPAARDLAAMLKGGEGGACVEKVYLTVVKGVMNGPMRLEARMVRDSGKNITKVLPEASGEGRAMVTEVRPLAAGFGFTLVEARLLTGRTHQIRAQLAVEGFPVIGDRKYGDGRANLLASQKYGLSAHLLHAYRMEVASGVGSLEYLQGRAFRARPPERFTEIAEDLGCVTKMKY